MGRVTIKLEVDATTRKRTIVVGYESDSDALPMEHEEEHRRLVEKLIEGGLIAAEEKGNVRVEREQPQKTKEAERPRGEEVATREGVKTKG